LQPYDKNRIHKRREDDDNKKQNSLYSPITNTPPLRIIAPIVLLFVVHFSAQRWWWNDTSIVPSNSVNFSMELIGKAKNIAIPIKVRCGGMQFGVFGGQSWFYSLFHPNSCPQDPSFLVRPETMISQIWKSVGTAFMMEFMFGEDFQPISLFLISPSQQHRIYKEHGARFRLFAVDIRTATMIKLMDLSLSTHHHEERSNFDIFSFSCGSGLCLQEYRKFRIEIETTTSVYHQFYKILFR